MNELYSHQEYTAQFSTKTNRVLDTSDPGTGKTRATLEGFIRRRANDSKRRLLVICPLSIVEPSWGNDIRRFTGLPYGNATGTPKQRIAAFNGDPPIVITNTDGVNFFVKKENRGLLRGFTDLCVDEFTAFKNRTSGRSKAMLALASIFDHGHITLLSGTAAPNTLLDLWHPMMVLDKGERLGSSYFSFRNSVCMSKQVGPLPQHVKWEDKPGMQAVVSAALADITVRHKFEDCLDVPEHNVLQYPVTMPASVMNAYRQMELESILLKESGELVTAVHAGARAQKLLQILSGAVYNTDGEVVPVHNDRYALVGELASARDHVIVAFTWQHEKAGLLSEFAKRDMTTAVIDGSISAKERANVVDRYQSGEIRALLCHPASAAHGLTLTRGRATIWCSATYRPEHFQQLNRRIYRAGQEKKTETICIYADGTKEAEVYEVLDRRMEGMNDLLDLMLTRNTHE